MDSPNQHQSSSESGSNYTASDYGFPPMSEHLSSREKQHNKQMEEFDTIVVRGRNSVGIIGGRPLQSISQNSSIIPPLSVGRKRSSRNSAIGGNSGRSSRNSDGRSVASANSSLRVKTNDDLKCFTGSATGHLESPTISSLRDAAGISQLLQPIPQYSQPAVMNVPSSSMMEYNMSTQENSAKEFPSGLQEGIMKVESESNSTPQWSETKTKAGKERKRLPLACIACRRKKIRCSGEKPACRHCLRSRVPCVYKQSARKVAPRTDYMAMLDRRLKKMEERLIKCIPKDEVSAVVAATGRSVLKPTASVYSRKRTVDEAFAGKELDEWAKRPSAKSSKGNNAEKNCTIQDIQVDSVDNGFKALPPLELQIHLAEVYFEYLYGQAYFLLHKQSFMRRLREAQVPPVLVLSVCAVSARFSNDPAVRYTPRYQAGKQFAAEASRLVLDNFDNPNMTILTSLLLLGLHEFGAMQGGKSWAFGGMATRMAYALSLHKEAEDLFPGKAKDQFGEKNPPYLQNMNRELRRRVMWACFTMDRFTSSGTMRLGMIIESDLEIQLPMVDKDLNLGVNKVTERLDGTVARADEKQDPRESMGVAAYMIRVIAVFGRVSKYLNLSGKEKDSSRSDPNSQFAKLNQQIFDFLRQLPDKLHYTEQNLQNHAELNLANQFLFIHVAYHHVQLCLHQYALPSSPQEEKPPREAQETQSAQIAVDSANRISMMLAKATDNGYRLVAPFMGYCAFTSANVHLIRAFSKDRSIYEPAKQHLSVNMKYLGQMKHYWGLFSHINETIRQQYRVYFDALTEGSLSPGNTQVLQYGDWFNKYPKGSSASTSDSESDDQGLKKPTAPSSAPRSPKTAEGALDFRLDLLTAEEYFARYGTASKAKPASSSIPTSAVQRFNPAGPLLPRQNPPHPSSNFPSHVSLPSVPTTSPIAQLISPVENLGGKLDPQFMCTMPPPPRQPQLMLKPLETFVAYGDQQHSRNSHTSMPHYQTAISPPPSISPTYTTFAAPPMLSRPGNTIPGDMAHHMTHQPQQSPTHFMYSYSPVTGPQMTGPSPPTPLSGGGMWGFDQQTADAAMLNPFHDQTAWFMPFNLDSSGYGGPSIDDEISMNGHIHHHLHQHQH